MYSHNNQGMGGHPSEYNPHGPTGPHLIQMNSQQQHPGPPHHMGGIPPGSMQGSMPTPMGAAISSSQGMYQQTSSHPQQSHAGPMPGMTMSSMPSGPTPMYSMNHPMPGSGPAPIHTQSAPHPQPIQPPQPQQHPPPQQQQQQQQQQPPQQAQPSKEPPPDPQQKIMSEPIEKVQHLVRQDLKASLLKLMKTTKDVMTYKAKALAATAQQNAAQTDPSSVKSLSGHDDGSGDQQLTPGEITAPDSVDSKPPSVKAPPSVSGPGEIRPVGSPSRATNAAAVSLQRALEHFHTVCDQIEHHFTLIMECQRLTRLGERHTAHIRSGLDSSTAHSLVQFKNFALNDVKFQNVVRETLEGYIKKLETVGSDLPSDSNPQVQRSLKRVLGDDSVGMEIKRMKVETDQLQNELGFHQSAMGQMRLQPAPLRAQRPSVSVIEDSVGGDAGFNMGRGHPMMKQEPNN